MNLLRKLLHGAFFISVVLLTPALSLAMPESFQSTLEGWQFQKVLLKRGRQDVIKNQIVKEVEHPLLNKKIQVLLSVQDQPGPHARQLVVLIPGTFGGADSVEITRLAETLYEKGYSTARFPNPLSSHFLKSEPLFVGLDYATEGRLYVDVTEKLRGEYNFNKVDLVGVSYGALAAAVMAHIYSESPQGFPGQLLMISPPRNILTSLKKIDGYFDNLKDEIKLVPSGHLGFALNLRWSLMNDEKLDISPELAKSVLVISGFHKGFRDLSGAVEDLKKGRFIPYGWYGYLSSNYYKRQMGLRFVPYLKEVNPNFFTSPEKLDVFYWLKPIAGHWQIFTSPDDFINEENVWPKNKNIHVYENGGHVFGYFGKDDFNKTFFSYF